jgi:hypothetical protein
MDTPDRLAEDCGGRDDGGDQVERPSTAGAGPAWAAARRGVAREVEDADSATSPSRRGLPRNEARIGVRPARTIASTSADDVARETAIGAKMPSSICPTQVL